MIRSIALLVAALAVSSVTLVGAGCGGSTSKSAASDAGGSDATSDVSNHPDGGGGGGDGGGLPEGSVAPQGTQLVASSTVLVNGVTSDGYVVYTDTSANTFSAVSLSGGTPTSIGGSDGTGEFAVGPVAFAFSNVDMNTGGGTLMIWTSAHGAQSIGTAVYAAFAGQGQLDISKDGTKLLYLDNTTQATVDATIINTDGSGKTVIAPALNFASQTCIPVVYFAGDYAVVENCSQEDGGVDSTLTSYTGTGWTTTATISSTVNGDFPFLVDPTGATVQYQSTAGLQVAAVATTTPAPVTVDATGTLGLFTSDGQHVVYTTTGGAINLAGLTGATPTTLVTAGAYEGLLGLTPDNGHVLAFKNLSQDNAGDYISDIYLASATTAGSATALVSDATAGLLGDVFTTDSSHATYMAAVANGNGNFTAAAISGGMPVTLGMTGSYNLSATAAKVVFNVNFNASGGGGGFGAADLQSVDLSAATPAPTLLVSQADGLFFLDQAKDKVVYSWSYLSNSQAGVWVLPLQ